MAIFLFKSSDETDGPSSQATRISTAVVKRDNLIISVSSTGIVEPIVTVDLKSKASGEIIDLPINEGDEVKTGQLIARLDDTTARNDHTQAQSDLEVARVALSHAKKQAERQEELYEKGLLSDVDYEAALLAREQANSDLARARAEMEDAAERLSDTVIESPIEGIILMKYVEEGHIITSGISNVSGGTVIATLADMSRVYVRASIDEVDIGQIAPGQKATVIAESYPDREFDGLVLRIHPLAKVEQNVTTFDVTIEVDNSEGLLLAGMNASIEIIAGYKEDVLLIPREALTDARSIAKMIGQSPGGMSHGGQMAGRSGSHSPGGPGSPGPGGAGEGGSHTSHPMRMVIVMKDDQPEPRRIEIGLSSFEQAEILHGLDEGDTVLTSVTSKALQDREAFVERMRSWSQLPGMEKKDK
jgi:HlyD family secretion protein